jgi:lauroyl/myristoyl acyltransferase
VRRALKAGEVVGFVVDRDVQGSGIATTFLGQPARISHAPAVLSLRTRAPIVAARTRRLEDGHFLAELAPPITPTPGQDAAALMALVLPWLEAGIRAAPGQWVMFESLWAERIYTSTARSAMGSPPSQRSSRSHRSRPTST